MDALAAWAARTPDKAAVIFTETGHADDERLSFATLDARSNRVAQWLLSLGLAPGDTVAMVMENCAEVFEIGFACARLGLYYTPINWHLTPREVAHVLRDSRARIALTTPRSAELGHAAAAEAGGPEMIVTGPGGGYEAALERFPEVRALPEDRPIGRDFLYSSGTTGLPKGVRKPLAQSLETSSDAAEIAAWRRNYGFDEGAVYLSPAPLYHAAPLRFCMRVVEVGGTCVVMRKFDAEGALAAIARHGVTHSQWVPTMFVRMLALPEEAKAAHDLSSMRVAVHAAAPCPVHVKQRMFDWWGPIIYEYYGGSEGFGITSIAPQDWLAHPGSVGKATLGIIHILDDDGNELPVGEIGQIWFEGGPPFEYFNDPDKTRKALNAKGWATYGDIGHVDAEGYLYLSDRRVDLILSGGVNVYPKEIEDVIMAHPDVADVAVIGVPHPEFGEEVKAIVELHDPDRGGPAEAAMLAEFVESRLPKFKRPRSWEFERLPRLANGKLMKRQLKDRYRVPA